MALIQCKECGSPVSTQAATCPKCGAPVPSLARSTKAAASGVWTVIKVGVALLAGAIVFSCVSVILKLGDSSPTASSGSSATPTAPRQPMGWDYETREDALLKKPTQFAQLKSSDQLNLQFPYQGENYGQLSVRHSPRHGLDAYFEIEKGQLVCGYSDCRIKVTFDNGPSTVFNMNKPADGSSTILFFSDAKRFIKAASAAKSIRVAAVVYQAGEPTLTFDAPTPLVWPPK
jgi:hypothetical protein